MTFRDHHGRDRSSVGSIVAFARPARLLMAGPCFRLLAVLVGIAGGTLAGYLTGCSLLSRRTSMIVTLATLAIFVVLLTV